MWVGVVCANRAGLLNEKDIQLLGFLIPKNIDMSRVKNISLNQITMSLPMKKIFVNSNNIYKLHF